MADVHAWEVIMSAAEPRRDSWYFTEARMLELSQESPSLFRFIFFDSLQAMVVVIIIKIRIKNGRSYCTSSFITSY